MLAIPAGDCFRPGAAGRAGRPSGLLSDIAAGAAVLRRSPVALRLVGADVMCSVVYGMQTVLLLLVARRSGLGLHGYGYLFAAIGVGALAGTALASRALRHPSQRKVLADMLAAVGLPMLLLAVVRGPAPALILVAVTGAGAVLVEILTETGLQRMLPPEVFGRAYGLALPAALAGIALGSLIAPLLVTALGTTGALIACGAAAPVYALTLPRMAAAAGAPAASQPVAAGRVAAGRVGAGGVGAGRVGAGGVDAGRVVLAESMLGRSGRRPRRRPRCWPPWRARGGERPAPGRGAVEPPPGARDRPAARAGRGAPGRQFRCRYRDTFRYAWYLRVITTAPAGG